MTLNEIKSRLHDIREHADDQRRAHAMEDELVWDFIAFLANDAEIEEVESAPELASKILESRKIIFSRIAG